MTPGESFKEEARAIARFHNALVEFEAALRETPIRLLGLEPAEIRDLLERLKRSERKLSDELR
jgi:hypothetical protein